MKNRNVTFITVFLALGCLALLQRAQGVVPVPDGCYPGFTTVEGCNALKSLTTGVGNTGIGWYSLYLDTTGSYSTGVGAGALALNNADSNTAVGAAALLLNTSGNMNVAVGTDALVHNTMGNGNTAVGFEALFSNTTSVANTAVGGQALASMTTGTANTAIGNSALDNLTTGSFNIVVGQGGASITSASNVICIGTGVDGDNVGNHTYIGNINSTTVSGGGTDTVTVNLTTGLLGHLSSSRRYKEEIQSMDNASETLYRLKPVTYRFKKEIDATQSLDYGLVAEEVAEVDPNLAIRDAKGQIESVRYTAINAMLLNEFLKEHRRVEEQHVAIAELKSVIAQQQTEFQAAIAEQRKEFEARLKQQDAKIQRVSDEVGLSKPAPQIVASDE